MIKSARNEHNDKIQHDQNAEHYHSRHDHHADRAPIGIPFIFESGTRLFGFVFPFAPAVFSDGGHIGYSGIIVVPDDFFLLFLVFFMVFTRHISLADSSGKPQNAPVRILYTREQYACRFLGLRGNEYGTCSP